MQTTATAIVKLQVGDRVIIRQRRSGYWEIPQPAKLGRQPQIATVTSIVNNTLYAQSDTDPTVTVDMPLTNIKSNGTIAPTKYEVAKVETAS